MNYNCEVRDDLRGSYENRNEIAVAEDFSIRGQYDAALTTLEKIIDRAKIESHQEYWASIALAKEARIYVHLEKIESASNCIACIPPIHRQLNPTLDALCLTIGGFQAKRKAWDSWKSGDTDSAVVGTLQSIEYFTDARTAALCAEDHLVAQNSALNIAYAKGQLAAIQQLPRTRFDDICSSIVMTEDKIQDEMPISKLDQITGVTMLAHVASGVGMTPSDVLKIESTEDRSAYVRAFKRVVGNSHFGWAEILLNTQRDKRSIRLEPLAKAAILGSSLLLRDIKHSGSSAENQTLLHAYEVRLLDVGLRLKHRTNETKIQKRIFNLVYQVAEAIGRPSPGIRLFR
jgi:hypothetical protein